MTTSKLLNVNNLNIYFDGHKGRTHAVKSVSFDIKRGEIIALVGESGSGKTVAAMSVLSLLDSDVTNISTTEMSFVTKSNKIYNIPELDENTLSQIRGKEIGMIFQEPMTSLNPVMKCGDQISEVLIIHGILKPSEAKKRVFILLKEVGLTDTERIYEAYPHQLSGGQKQRVMIAMAMACDPALLIADEPTTALDVTVQKKILSLLKSLCEKKEMAMLFISHDLNIVKELADRILVMYKGEIVEQGTVREIFHSPKHPYTKGLLSCRPPVKSKLRKLPVLSDFMNDQKLDPDRFTSNENIVSAEEHNSFIRDLEKQTPLLEVTNITTSYTSNPGFFWNKPRKFTAIDQISFKLYKGEVLGIVGESGSGKSTLGRTICKLVDAESGTFVYKGKDLTNIPESQFRSYRKDIQIIFQDPYASLNPSMKVGKAILEPMRVHHMHENDLKIQLSKVYELLENVGLPSGAFEKYPHEFSGGQRQRISIARALSLEPKLLICDEAVSALDVNVQAQVLNLLNELKLKYDLTILFITHDLSVVRFLCDRVLVMKDGTLMETGTVDQVLDAPVSEYTKLLLESLPGINED